MKRTHRAGAALWAAMTAREGLPAYLGRASEARPVLHPTKGWRGRDTIPAGTNRRRRRLACAPSPSPATSAA